MDAAQWVTLFQQLPPEIHDGFSFVMSNGLEIIVQALMRLDEAHVMIRGRVSGSTDAGRILFIPYDQINCMIYNKSPKDPEVYSWFTGIPTVGEVRQTEAAVAAAAEAAEQASAEPEQEPAPAAQPQPQKPAAAGQPQKPAAPPQPPKPVAPQPMPTMGNMSMPAKAAMIERLRKRAQGGGNPPEQK